jgi:hypothetical protein
MRDVHGQTAVGFEPVRDVLARASLDDGGAAFAVMLGESALGDGGGALT